MATIKTLAAGVSPYPAAAAEPTVLVTTANGRPSTVAAASAVGTGTTVIVNGQAALNNLITTNQSGVFDGANITINLEEQNFNTTNQVTATTNYPSGNTGEIQYNSGANSFASDAYFTYTNSNVVTPGIRTNNYLYGNGAPFTGGGNAAIGNFVFSGDTMSISDSNQIMNITGNGTGNIQVNSNSKVWVFNNVGNLTLPSNSSGINYANGSPYGGGNYSNSNVSSFLAAFGSNVVSTTGNITGGNLTTTGTANIASLAVTGSVTVQGSIGVSSWITVSSYLSANGNILTGNNVSAAGNVTGNFFIGNGSQLTGIAVSYGNANVVANLAALGSNPVSTTGNVTGGNLLFGAGIVSGTGNITGGNLSGTSITGTLTTGTQSAITSVGTLTNMSTSGNANVTGNVNSARVSATGNITAGNILTGGLISVAGNITAGNLDAVNLVINSITSDDSTFVTIEDGVNVHGEISATGNITGNYILGNGSQLTGISTANIGNVTFNDVNIIGDGNLRLQPGPGNADTYLDIYLTAGPDIHIAGNGETVILGTDTFANVTVNVDGNLSIQASNGTPHTWTFDTTGKLVNLEGLTLAAGGQFNICTINNAGSGYTSSTPLPATTTGGNGTGMTVAFGYGLAGQLVGVSVVSPGTGYNNGDIIGVDGGTGTFVITQYNDQANQGNNNFIQSNWTFGSNGDLTAPGNISATNLVINSITSDDSTFVTIEDGVNITTGSISSQENLSLTASAQTWTFRNDGVGIVLPGGAAIRDTSGGSLAIGVGAGALALGNTAVAIGYQSAFLAQGNNSVAIGRSAGETQGEQAVAIGLNAGRSQGNYAVAIGKFSANSSQGEYSVAIGPNAGFENQLSNAVSIGSQAGASSQGINSVAVGVSAAYNTQGNNAVAVGNSAGYLLQGLKSVAIGDSAGIFYQGNNAVAMGFSAGYDTQGTNSVAVGSLAGNANQGLQAVAIGLYAGTNTQGQYSVAIGGSAGATSQGQESVAVGVNSGSTAQGIGAVSIGASSGASSQGNTSVAIGTSSGALSQGANAVAIGYQAGYQSQGNNSIILNATGAALNQTTANTFTVAPVRNDVANIANIMFYNATSKEITYGNTVSVTGNVTSGNILTGGLISATGNVTANNGMFTNIVNVASHTGAVVSVSGNVTGGNVLTGGLISATGNVTANNGMFTNIVNVASHTGTLVSVTGNVTANNGMFTNIVNVASHTGAVVSVSGNVTGGNVLTGGLISATANITGGNILTGGLISATANITGGNLSVTGNVTGNTAGFAIGYLNVPQVSFAGNATIAATDAGKHYYSVLSTANVLTIANNTSVTWAVGTAISLVNRGTGNITVAQGTGVSLYLAGNITSGNRTVATYGMATLLNVAANIWMINGTGVT